MDLDVCVDDRGEPYLVERKSICPAAKQINRGLEEGYFCGASPIFRRRFFSWSALQYLQSRRIKTDVYGMVIFVFSTST
jgi:hypothetical protein